MSINGVQNCVPETKIINTPSDIRVDLGIYYKSSIYLFNEFSLNFWIKLSSYLNYYYVMLIGNYAVIYNSQLNTIILKDTTRFGQDNIYNNFYTLTQLSAPINIWLPLSMNYKQDSSGTYSMLQLSVDSQYSKINTTSIITILTELEFPINSYQIRNLKFWDNFIDLDQLQSANYMYLNIFNLSLENSPPTNLIAYYLLTEGYFLNRGSSSLVIIRNSSSINWITMKEKSIPFCNQTYYYDTLAKMCISKDISLNLRM